MVHPGIVAGATTRTAFVLEFFLVRTSLVRILPAAKTMSHVRVWDSVGAIVEDI